MSEIKALESAREHVSVYAADCDQVWMLGFLDEIQAEVDSRFMELPVDADGVPIRVGDLVSLEGRESFEVGGIRDTRNQWHVFPYSLQRWYSPLDLHHVKPRTLENVLEEYYDKRGWDEADNHALEAESLTAQYAAEIRELLGGDAE